MQSGKMLAHYRVEEKIGVGGMGEVYRAHDTTLSRDVALKVLPARFAEDRDRLARFKREAKVLASLHHTNIASIFGFEVVPDCTFLAMELVEGDDLSEIIKRGPLSVEDSVEIARQIAEGLEEAHEKGIIHRDLKPANVKRSSDGRVKVLDFGLARVYAGQTAGEGEVGSEPTMTAVMTQAGTVLGTAAYMSPEQARGLEVDRRTDIWAFGVILFEMLTGKQLFAGETASDTLAGILKTEPEWEDLPDDLPFQVERVLRRCLTKDPRQRLRDIGEARVRLEDPEAESMVFSGPISAATMAIAEPPKSSIARFVPWGLLVISLAALGWFALEGNTKSEPAPSWHVAIPAPPEADFAVSGSFPGLPVISPDSRHIAFSAKSVDSGETQLHVRAMGVGKDVRLDGTEDAQYPFWSPDGRWIGFFDRSEGMKKIMVGGGPAQSICGAVNAKGGSWSQHGEIVFTPEYNSSIYLVPAVGGEPRQITDVMAEEGFDSHRHPQFLPDGRRFLYLARAAGGLDSELRMRNLDDDSEQVVMKTSFMVQYASGHLLFLNRQTLMAQPFDPITGELSGVPVPIAEDVMIISGAAKGAFSASDDGTLTYLKGKANVESSLVWVDRNGNAQGIIGDQADYDNVVLSPDNSHAAVSIIDEQAGTGDLWIIEIERNFRTRFTSHLADETFPVWHPDGNSVFYLSDQSGKYAVYQQTLGRTGEEKLVFEHESAIFLWDVANDGHTILFSTLGSGTSLDLWSADLDGNSEPRQLRATVADDGAAKFSPDGQWVSFWSEESGNGQVYLAPWPEMAPVSQVSTTTGGWSFWNASGRELIFQDQNGGVIAVPLTPNGKTMKIGKPEPLFDHAALKLEGAWLDFNADGEGFLAIDSDASDPPAYCDVVTNWPDRIRTP